jgi:hypothetical protein
MQKVKLSDEQLGLIANLKRSGKKWTQIQRETGIPRRVAKREYEEWESKQAFDDLKQARTTVAAEAFRDHVDSLIKIAEHLVLSVRTPVVNDIDLEADQYLDEQWKTEILIHHGTGTNSLPHYIRTERVNLRENRILYNALRIHTELEVQWNPFDKWKDLWNGTVTIMRQLRENIHKEINNFFSQENAKPSGFMNSVIADTDKPNAIEILAKAILTELVNKLDDEKANSKGFFFRVLQQSDDNYHVTPIDSYAIILKFKNDALADKVNEIANKVANNMYISFKEDLRRLKNDIDNINNLAYELEEKFNPLVLRPIILRTRCRLCPA